jgi:hypothetical protein
MFVRRAVRGALARTLLAAVLMTLFVESSTADWVQTSGPRGGSISALLAVPTGAGGTNLFAGQIQVWRTGDQGVSWTRLTNGLTDPNAFDLIAVSNGSGGNDIFLGSNTGVFRSTNQGATWSRTSTGLPSASMYALAAGSNGAGGMNLYAGAGGFVGKVFRSADNGASWTEASSGLPAGQTNIEALLTTPSGTVLAGTGNGIYRSTNFGASWTRVFTLYGLSLAKHGSTLYAGTSNGVYKSTNDGASWTPINSGMTFNWVYALAAVPNGTGVILFANLMRSIDGGATWTLVNTGLPTPSVYAYAHALNASGGTDVYIGTSRGVFRSSNFGSNWTDVSFIYSQIQAVESTPSGAVLAGSENVIYRTTDAGGTWTDPGSGTTALDFAVNRHSPSGTSIFAGSSPAGIYKSTNDGVTWVQSSNGLDDFDVNSIGAIPNGAGGTNLLAGSAMELFISTNDGGHWQPANLQTLLLDYTATPNGSGGHNVWAAGYGGVWLSTNYGTAWTPRSGGIAGQVVQGIAATAGGANLFAGGDPFGVFRSTNQGVSWSPANNGIADLRIVTVFSPDGANLFAAGAGGVYLSTDNGNSWVGTGLGVGVYQLATSTDGTTLFAGTTGSGVWKRPLSEMIGGPPPPPPSPPVIASFAPASGSAGTVVTISGSNFTGASSVTFNLVAASFTVVSGTQIQATVPAGATTGRIRVTTPDGTGTSASDFSVTAPPPPTTLTFTPPHDATVRVSSKSSNFGSRSELSVRSGSQTMRSYLKFVVSGVTGSVQAARLRLRVTDPGPDGGFVYSVSNNFNGSSMPWTESRLTWNNAPPLGTNRGYAGTATANTWVEVDVTAAVNGNGTFSFAVSGGSSNQVDYSSSEGAHPPQLVLVVSGSAASQTAESRSSSAELGSREITLRANQPNPFRATTTIQYSLPERMPVRLRIYDITGRMVRTLVDGVQEAGARRVTWDGRDEHGALVNSGMYMYRLEAAGATLTRKMSLLK